MDAFQIVCPRCGRQVAPVAAPAPIPYFYTRVHRHVHTVAILWLAYAAWITLHWVLAVGFLAGFSHHWGHHMDHGFDGFYSFPFAHFPWFVPLISVILAARAILCIVTGLALLRRAPWARTLAIVIAFLTLIRPLTGTILAIYTLWVLLPGASGQEYQRIIAPQPM
uniref:Uncharacterized protein n=2 Tax=Paracidobacterium acidisoli TaxID=2303751 RepID=A0A372IMU1_9BACT